MPIRRATSSTCCSSAQQACGAVGARTDPEGCVFVYTICESIRRCGIRYGPATCIAASCGKNAASAV